MTGFFPLFQCGRVLSSWPGLCSQAQLLSHYMLIPEKNSLACTTCTPVELFLCANLYPFAPSVILLFPNFLKSVMAHFFLEFLWENFFTSSSTILFFHWLCKLGALLISQETVLCSCEMTSWRPPGVCRYQFSSRSLGFNCFSLCCWPCLLWWAVAAGGAVSYWGSDEREGSCLVPWAQ